MTVSRIILFKMPAPDRIQYVQKLMDIIGSPPNLIIQLTTYRNKWIPTEVFNNPENIKEKLAWIVCVDAQKTSKGTIVQNFIPVREVKIVEAKRNDDTLVLWLITGNYLKCADYQKFRRELEASGQPLPPAENSYILPDIKINSVDIVGSQNIETENGAWKRIVDMLSTMDVFRNAVFYRVIAVTDKNNEISPQNAVENEAPYSYYQMAANKTYSLKIHYYLPEKQFEFCPQPIEISSENKWIKFYGESKISDRVGNININLKPLNVSDPYPYEHAIVLTVSLGSAKLVAPKIELQVLLGKEPTRTQLRRNLRMIVCTITSISLFIIGEILAGYYPLINGVSPVWQGIPISIISSALSTLAIVLIPIALTMWKKDD